MNVVDRLYRRIVGLLAIGRITTVNDTGGTQLAQIQISALETRDNTPVVAHFGFSSNAPAGAIAVTIFGSGDHSKGVIVATGDANTRPTGQNPGETAIYNTFSMSIELKEAGIVINTGGIPVLINGDLHATGAIIAGFGGADQVGVQTHKHPANNTPPTAGT